PGVETGIISARKAITAVERSSGLFGRKKARSTEERHLLITVVATPVTFEDMISAARESDPKIYAIEFTPEELAALPEYKNMEEVLERVEPYAISLSAGDVVLGFRLDPALAAKNNVNSIIDVEIKGL